MSCTRNSNSKEAGFTLIEILNVIVMIGILGAVGIPQFSQYKNKAYDIHAKRALKDMHLLCNAFWIDTYPAQECDLPTIKGTYYGFNQNPDVLATLPPAPSDAFCATAKHDSSPNVFSINNASLISSGEKCGVSIVNASFPPRPAYVCAGTFQDPCPTIACDEDCTKQKAQDRLLAVINGLPDLMKPSSDDIDKSIQEIQSRTYSEDSDGTPTMNQNSSVNELLATTMEPPPPPPAQTFEGYIPEVCADGGEGLGSWVAVDSNGKLATRPRNAEEIRIYGAPGQTIAHGGICSCSYCGPGGGIYEWGGPGYNNQHIFGGKGTLADNGYKLVYEGNQGTLAGSYQSTGDPKDLLTYNFATGIWSLPDGRKRDSNGNWLQ